MEFFTYDFDVSGLRLACFVRGGTGQSVHRDRPSHGLALKCSGKNLYHFSDGKSIETPKGEIIYLPKDSNYWVESVVQGDCYAINFDLRETVCFQPFSVEVKDYAAFLELFRKCERLWRQKGQGYRLKCRSILYDILYRMQQEHRSYVPDEKYARIQPAVRYINENYNTAALCVTGLAEMCGMSPEYFRRIFAAHHGTSPSRYIRSLRMERMAELLSSGMYGVTEAAALSGFDDLSYCSREFKKQFGVSPRAYAKGAK